jgi:hypothetical protein
MHLNTRQSSMQLEFSSLVFNTSHFRDLLRSSQMWLISVCFPVCFPSESSPFSIFSTFTSRSSAHEELCFHDRMVEFISLCLMVSATILCAMLWPVHAQYVQIEALDTTPGYDTTTEIVGSSDSEEELKQ